MRPDSGISAVPDPRGDAIPHDRTSLDLRNASRPLKIAIFIEHNIVYRHFIQSRVFFDLAAHHDVIVVFPASDKGNKRFDIPVKCDQIGMPSATIAVNYERLFQWRRLFQVMQLQWRPGKNWRYIREMMRHNIGPRATIAWQLLGAPLVFPVFRRITLRNVQRLPAEMEDFIKSYEPDVMIHPTVLEGYFINDFVTLGKNYEIPTIAIMNSWDNPATKRAVVGTPDWLLVWGEQTRQLAIEYVGMPPDRVLSFGAAQFEVYRQPPRVTREAFCRDHCIEPGKRILLYAGSSKGSDEYAHLRLIEDAIDRGVLQNLAVIYRPHPWGLGGYKGERIIEESWSHVRIDSSMRNYLEDVREGRTSLFLADYTDTHDTLSAVDAVVSPLSTILLEAALHEKPFLCFIPDAKEGSTLHMQTRFEHFSDMFGSPMALIAEGDCALVEKVGALMDRIGDAHFVETLRRECAHFVEPFEQDFGVRLTAFVESVAAATR